LEECLVIVRLSFRCERKALGQCGRVVRKIGAGGLELSINVIVRLSVVTVMTYMTERVSNLVTGSFDLLPGRISNN
jgi:hypothetical protein